MRRLGSLLGAVLALALSANAETRTIVQGDSHVHEVDLSAEHFVTVRVTEIDIDLKIEIADPTGTVVAKVPAPAHRPRLSFIARNAGRHRITIAPYPESSLVGRYDFEVIENRPAVASDQERLAAQAAFDEAAALFSAQKGASIAAAAEPLRRALAQWKALGDCEGEAETLYALATVRAWAEDPGAEAMLEEALKLQQAIGDTKAAAETQYQISTRRRYAGDAAKARERSEQSLAGYRAVGSAAGEAQALNSLGLLEGQAGNHRAAIAYYEEALRITRSVGTTFQEALLLNNIAVSRTSFGDWRGALASFERAAAIYRRIGERRELANTLMNIGGSYVWLGEYRDALAMLHEALPILEDLNDLRLLMSAHTNIGITHLQLGELKEARESLLEGLRRASAVDDFNRQGMVHRHLGRLAEKENAPAAALEGHQRSRALWQLSGNRRGEAFALLSIEAVQLRRGNEEEARAAVNEATAIICEIGDPGLEAAARYALARVERVRDPMRAWREIEAALAHQESVRGNVAGHHLRAAHLTTVRDQYELAVSVLVQLHRLHPGEGYDMQAWQISERARARGLVDMLTEAQIDIRSDADPALLARERQLRDALNDKAARFARQPGKQPKLGEEIDAIVAEIRKVEARIHASSPRYAALKEPQITTLRELRERALDEDTMLVEIALGDERSFVWTVTTTSSDVQELPARREIEGVARRVYDALTARNQRQTETPAARATRLAVAKKDFARASAELSAMLRLDRPHPKKRLLVVAEGALQYVPFAALPGKSGRPLVVDHEIVSMPSVSALLTLRHEVEQRAPAPGVVAVLADPVFSKSDPRVGGPSLVSHQRDALARLPLTRDEAESILRLAQGKERVAALGFDASLDAVTGGALGHYRYVHFATHGIVDSTRPELSAIVLSLVDEHGEPRNGYLRLHDIYNLRLPADLVVLSACQTALGKEMRAEGLLGLTRGFMYAGAARVVASLWKIDDRATAELMKRFYARMLGPERQPPAAALRAAQIEMARSARWTDPYHWAAFTLQGEWR